MPQNTMYVSKARTPIVVDFMLNRFKNIVENLNVHPDNMLKNTDKFGGIVFSQKVLLNADGYSYVKSAPTRIIKVVDPKVYQEFFAQLDKSIFYEGI